MSGTSGEREGEREEEEGGAAVGQCRCKTLQGGGTEGITNVKQGEVKERRRRERLIK